MRQEAGAGKRISKPCAALASPRTSESHAPGGAGASKRKDGPSRLVLKVVGGAPGPASARYGVPGVPLCPSGVEVHRDLTVYIAQIKVGQGAYLAEVAAAHIEPFPITLA